MNVRSVALLLLLPALAAQDPAPVTTTPASAADLLARFQALPAAKRTEVVRSLEGRLQRAGDEAIQRVVARTKGRGAYPPQPKPRWLSPADFAPNATPRALVTKDNELHSASTRGMAPQPVTADLTVGVVYDWSTATIVQASTALTDEHVFTNLVNGHLPGSDEAMAIVLAALDGDAEQKRNATLFGHLYADRDGRVFAGITLYDAWNSGKQIEMPDTDAIAFARQILGTSSFSAPLPADRRRDRLYAKMREAFATHREYRSLRNALAATFSTAAPKLDPAYESLVPRCHWLWAQCDDDLPRMAERLRRTADRTALLQEVDAAMATDASAGVRRAQDLADLATHLRALAEHEIARANG